LSTRLSSFISDDGIVAAKEKGVFLSMDVYNSDYILSEGEKAGILEESLAKERVVQAFTLMGIMANNSLIW